MMSRKRPALIFPVLVLLSTCVTAQTLWPTQRWPTASPSAVGLDSTKLAAFDADIAGGKYGYIDSMLIIRQGKLVFERFVQT